MSRCSDRLRVAIDARPLSHPQHGGFRTYVRSLISGLRERALAGETDVDLLVYLDRDMSEATLRPLLPPGAEVRVLDTRRLRSDLILFPRQLRRDAPDLFHGTANYLPGAAGTPSTVTIHDAMGVTRHAYLRQNPNLRQRMITRYWERMTRRSAQRARRIVTVSRSAAREIAAALPRVSPARISAVYNGVSMPSPSAGGETRADNVVLALASPDPRKNLKLLYRALGKEGQARFGGAGKSPRLDIVCTNATAAARAGAAVEEFGVADFRLLIGLDDQALSNAYAQSTLFVWPSRHEGFGLPPLEAMRCGCPVVTSSAPSMPEVLGDAALYFYGLDDPAALSAALSRVLGDSALQEDLSERGRVHSEQFTCQRMADATVEVWRSALAGGVAS